MLSRPLTVAALLLALTAASSPALAGQKVTTPLLRVADPAGTARGSVQVKLKGQGSSVTVRVLKLDDEVATPLGVFLEDATEADDFTQVGTIETLKKGAGKLALSSTDGAPSELGVETLDDLADRRLEVRDANGAALLDAVLPGLAPFAGTKLVAKLLPPDGAPAPAASATLTGKPTNAKGSERFRLKAKKLPAGAAEVFIEDAPGSGNFLSAGELAAGLFQRDTALGDRLPLEVAAQAALVDCAIEVRDGETVLLAGTIAVKGKPGGVSFPLTGVIVLEKGEGFVDRYLRVVGDFGPLYRSLTDLDEVSAQDLADTDEALWRLDKIGQTANGPLVTVTLVGHEDTWWLSAVTGDTHYVHVQKQNADPAQFDYAHFILRMGSPVNGKPSFLIESAYYPGEFLVDEGHILTGNGVKLDGGGMTLLLL